MTVHLPLPLPLPQRCAHLRGDGFGIAPMRPLWAVAAVVACVASGPAAPVVDSQPSLFAGRAAARAHQPARAYALRNLPRTVMRSDDESIELPVYLEQPAAFHGQPAHGVTDLRGVMSSG
ncbi:hypothetical protein ABH931_002765 [Streptacidiphilus sp. MAP12-33]|uniref:hypothetical protein n=1 Tax=Streptacidiphilus sp. MAP12-33 TaxID=3156266 RepID=UPI003516C6F9